MDGARKPGARLVSPAAGAGFAKGHCRVARDAGCRATESDAGSPRICAYRHAARSKASCKRCSIIRERRSAICSQRGDAMAGRTDPGLSPAVHPEAGKRGRSGARVQLRVHQSVARVRCRPIGRWGHWCGDCWITATTPAACWKTGCGCCSACFAMGLSCSECRSRPRWRVVRRTGTRRCSIGWHGVSARLRCCSIAAVDNAEGQGARAGALRLARRRGTRPRL